jgi:hypothetical protein
VTPQSQGYVCPDETESLKFRVAQRRLPSKPSRWTSKSARLDRPGTISGRSPAYVPHEVPRCIAGPQLFGWNVFRLYFSDSAGHLSLACRVYSNISISTALVRLLVA